MTKALVVLLALISIFLGAFTFMHLWSWFVAPVTGLPDIGMAQSLGLVLVAQFLAYTVTPPTISATGTHLLVERIGFMVAALALGWIIAQFL